MHTFRNSITIIIFGLILTSCSSMISSATNKMAKNLSSAIINNDDLATVKSGAPAYLLMLDSFIEGDPNDSTMLLSASKLYSAYAGVFVKDAERAKRLTQKSLDFALTANCLESSDRCNLKSIDFNKFEKIILQYKKEQIEYLFTLGSSWAGWIQSHSDDWNAAADLARVTTIMNHALKLDERYQSGQIHLYLGVLNTLLPPALGGKPEVGKHHFETAILFSDNKNLMAKVIYAEKYARLMFKQELHDQLLNEVLKTEPRSKGFTLTNMLAHKQAKELLASGKDYF
ncbi:MAG: TRAP transporter TatT component family protein [Gammaproteobacteria bacterium]|nr:TRAP transporter TatT component family protein [Gammaproteobacteria bacterium]MCW9031036.1 TRAP transporter TatT component family protein [Gammaproteobacteria bacterium]